MPTMITSFKNKKKLRAHRAYLHFAYSVILMAPKMAVFRGVGLMSRCQIMLSHATCPEQGTVMYANTTDRQCNRSLLLFQNEARDTSCVVHHAKNIARR